MNPLDNPVVVFGFFIGVIAYMIIVMEVDKFRFRRFYGRSPYILKDEAVSYRLRSLRRTVYQLEADYVPSEPFYQEAYERHLEFIRRQLKLGVKLARMYNYPIV